MTLADRGGVVHVVSTPIGNLEDTTARAVRVLREAAVIACEDTRRTARLCAHFGIRTPRISLHEHNEVRRLPGLLDRLAAGESVAVVCDAGTPLVSDPAARLVRAAIDSGFGVVPVPGPSAVMAALVSSGLPADRFAFFGFRPRRGRARAEWLDQVAAFSGTAVLFEAPGRVAATLDELFQRLGPRPVAIAREMTKLHEQVLRGRLGEIEFETARGEVTIVVGAGEESEPRSLADPASLARELIASGMGTREVAREVAAEADLSQKEAYALALRARERAREKPDPAR